MSEYLFPIRQTRRDFLGSAAAAAAAASAGRVWAAEAEPKGVAGVAMPEVKIGAGKATYTLDPSWGALPEGMKYGFGCGIVVDGQDRVIVTTRSTSPCVAIFDKDGKLVETWSKEFAAGVGFEKPEQVAATAHGLYWSKEADGEFLYWTENVAGGKNGPKIGARVYKTDLKGKVLHTLGNVASEGPASQKFDFTNPTDVAVAPNGDIYIVDGYGSQLVHRFDKSFKHLKTMGGRGKEHGKFNTCHGVWVNTLKTDPEVYIADRANNRIEVYSPELEYKRTVEGLRAPCCFYQAGGLTYVPELGARVTILDADEKVVAHLGDGAGIKSAEIGKHPDKFATPHALTVTADGSICLLEWLPFGRVRKFKHTPSA
jgi:hypothetical protein